MLRAVRFAAAFNFVIDADTLRAIQEMASEINTVSAERIGMEIRRMLTGAHRAVALSLLRETNLLPYVLLETANGTADEFDETRRVVAALESPSLSLAMAALLQSAQRSSGSPLAAQLGRRLRYTNKEIELASWLLNNRPQIEQAKKLLWPKLQRILTHEGATELVALHEAIAGPDDAALAFCRERLAWPAERLNPLPLVDGSDLIRHGLEPGPPFAELLEQVRDAQLNGEIHTRDDALAMVDRFLGRG
jgi:tRNA nucleotidyltransferase/poly(A) polymerase